MALSANEVESLPAFLTSDYPVFLPEHFALTASDDAFDNFVRDSLNPLNAGTCHQSKPEGDKTSSNTDDLPSTATNLEKKIAEMKQHMSELTHDCNYDVAAHQDAPNRPERSFLSKLEKYGHEEPGDLNNKMMTDNGDLTNVSANNALVDLFFEMENLTSGERLELLLDNAWTEDSLATLKLIFNARSIHLGKGSKSIFYRAVGWLSYRHPVTFVANLRWLSRPVIEKKISKDDIGDDIVIVDLEKSEVDQTRFDVKNGVAHGYWKDLLNILVLSVNCHLDVKLNPEDVLNVQAPAKLYQREWDAVVSKQKRDILKDRRHENAVSSFSDLPTYQCYHMAVARLFAQQIESDLKLLRDADAKGRKNISLCAKWAPSQKGFHDKHTFIVSSIAEIIHPQTKFPGVTDRNLYLRHAREAYRKDVSALRKALEVVERDISSEQFTNIKYDHVPSLAMHNYASIFLEKDRDRFEQYVDQVAAGKKQISGATLLPSTLIMTARNAVSASHSTSSKRLSSRVVKSNLAKVMVDQKLQETKVKVVDAQWKTLVQRIRDSGSLENCIAVCDVSGSMMSPTLQDGSTPMDSAIGLSLLIAEVTKDPFGGKFITFSESPAVATIDRSATLHSKIDQMVDTNWGFNTDFVAVFEDLILPMARENQLAPSEMVKRIFVFSDMQFDEADHGSRWTTSFERIQAEYRLYGYEMPELVFWNLAGGRQGIAPKPVTKEDVGTALVSGYSQGMLKVFLENGSFEADEEELVVGEEAGEDEDVLVVEKKKRKLDPLAVVNKAIGHKAYEMLKVLD